MTLPYYWRERAKYGDFEVHMHYLTESCRVLGPDGTEVYRSQSEQKAHEMARIQDIAARSGVSYEQLVCGVK